MKDVHRKKLPRELPVAAQQPGDAHRLSPSSSSSPSRHISTGNKKVESLRIEPHFELHRSSSGRNLRLKPAKPALASPHGLTPRAPDRKRPPEPPPPTRHHSLPAATSPSDKKSPRQVDNQVGSIKKTTRAASTSDRRCSFSIHDVGLHLIRQPPTPQNQDDEDQQDDSNNDSPSHGGDTDESKEIILPQITEEPQAPTATRPVYEFELWKQARKSPSLADAINIRSEVSSARSPARPARVGRQRSVSDADRSHMERQGMQKAREMAQLLQHGQTQPLGIRIDENLVSLSLTRSTSPTIGAYSRSGSSTRMYTLPPADDGVSKMRWRRGELIGEGTFGKVYMALNSDTGELFALKEIEIRSSGSADQMRQLQKLGEEIALMHNLTHKHIVRYKGSQRTDRHFYIFMEYVPGGSIASMLRQFNAFGEDLVRIFTRQIVAGVVYLHEMGIIHRDIKGANVLVNEQGISKLADFGCSKQLQPKITASLEESLRSMRGSIPWMAPEVVNQTGHGFKADIWSIGATVIEMATGQHPWPACTNSMAVILAIAKTESPPPIPSSLSAEAKSFLARCFCIDPEDRATAVELSQHPFLREH
ncbi:hypothetical protein ATCC90586_007971 [Pythium insidiosum]|nr:hypothetical protein ATCC90586_007971 [Pythium insidiosum]